MEIKPQLDDNGHLQDLKDWSKDWAKQMADEDKLQLTDKHWQIIHLVRQIYLDTETTPPMRLLIKAIRVNLSEDMANSRYLYQLFPDGPVRLACKYGGLPKPKHCL
jgi:tRNA 2-thiouridine synthesizing protein E